MANISKDSFNAASGYDKVLFTQQGALLDFDINEAQDIARDWRDRLASQLVEGSALLGSAGLVRPPASGLARRVDVVGGIMVSTGKVVRLPAATDLRVFDDATVSGTVSSVVYAEWVDSEVDHTTDPAIKPLDTNLGNGHVRLKRTVTVKVVIGSTSLPSPAAGVTQRVLATVTHNFTANGAIVLTSDISPGTTSVTPGELAGRVPRTLRITSGALFGEDAIILNAANSPDGKLVLQVQRQGTTYLSVDRDGKLAVGKATRATEAVDVVGNLTLTGNIILSTAGATVDGVDLGALKTAYDAHNHDAAYLKLSGGTVTGNLTVSGTGSLGKLALPGGHSIEKERNGSQTDLEIWHGLNTSGQPNAKFAMGTAVLLNAPATDSNALQLWQERVNFEFPVLVVSRTTSTARPAMALFRDETTNFALAEVKYDGSFAAYPETALTSGSMVGGDFLLRVKNTAASTAVLMGSRGNIIAVPTAAHSGSLLAGVGETVLDATATASLLGMAVGLYGAGTNLHASQTITNAYGVYGTARALGNGGVTNAYALYGYARNNAAATIARAYGAAFQVSNLGTGTITEAFGARVMAVINSGGGVVGTNYGLYLDEQTVGNTKYTMYAVGGLVYLGGTLEVVGSIKEGGTLLSAKYSAVGHTHTFASLTSKPTTLAGFGITDGALANHNHDATYLKLAGGTTTGPITSTVSSGAGLVLSKGADAARNFLRWNQGTAWWQAGFRSGPYTWALEYLGGTTNPADDTGWVAALSVSMTGLVTTSSLEVSSRARLLGNLLDAQVGSAAVTASGAVQMNSVGARALITFFKVDPGAYTGTYDVKVYADNNTSSTLLAQWQGQSGIMEDRVPWYFKNVRGDERLYVQVTKATSTGTSHTFTVTLDAERFA